MQHQPTLGSALADYQALRAARYSATTVRNEGHVLSRFVAFTGDIQCRHLTPQHVERFFYGPNGVMSDHKTRDGKTRDRVRASTHNYYRTRLKGFFGYLAQRGLTRAPLLDMVTPMRVPVLDRLQPSVEVLWDMLETAPNPRDRAVLAVSMNTGLRTSEILRLRVSDVDFDSGSLRVWISKSSIEDRVPITSDLAQELQRWLLTYRTDCASADRPIEVTDDAYLLPGQSGPRYRWRTEEDGTRVQYQVPGVWNPSAPVRKPHEIVQAALYRAGLPTRHEGIHTLRRAVARHYFDMLNDEGSYDRALRMTASLLHHQSIVTTERYLGLSKDRLDRDESLRGRSLLGPRPTPAEVRQIR